MKLLTTPHPFLNKTVKPVLSWTPKLEKQLLEMTTLLKASKDPQGIGLAAPQVGINKRFFIIINQKDQVQVFINPKIIKKSS